MPDSRQETYRLRRFFLQPKTSGVSSRQPWEGLLESRYAIQTLQILTSSFDDHLTAHAYTSTTISGWRPCVMGLRGILDKEALNLNQERCYLERRARWKKGRGYVQRRMCVASNVTHRRVRVWVQREADIADESVKVA